ncbi:hypothetical protein PRIPAC_90304 [Pristionchus pacificus]|uniref:Fucosyltransferase n=1 Tax=Pristionchus pacificus TaxID=54126 RepID=A0A2A6CXA9_PRIPA|nr:hypothetical protein PRIPAC_90304 [Pristionchus pacificus]|eukprot:PDM82730.1 hypothetical protein PRIPAC_37123 [Pristionchus pacificus]
MGGRRADLRSPSATHFCFSLNETQKGPSLYSIPFCSSFSCSSCSIFSSATTNTPDMETHSIAAIFLLLISLLFIFIAQTDPQRLDTSISSFIILNITAAETKRVPKILAWTPYFSRKLEDRIRSDSCPFQCDVFNRSQLSEEAADAIVFHFRDLHENMPLPRTRRPDQIYVSFLKEAPAHAGSGMNSRIVRFAIFSRPESKGTQEAFDKIVNSKTDAVLAIISNCHAESGRLEYIRELDKYINVTKVGACFGSRISNEDVEKMIASHSFVIAFENIQCEYYATEKFWRITKDIVPIVLQRSILKDLVPSSAFVAADDFRSPLELAEHLMRAAECKDEYRKYFAWRNTHYRQQVDGFCNLCRDLHFKNVSTSAHLNMKEYYSVSRECEFDTAAKLLGKLLGNHLLSTSSIPNPSLLFSSITMRFFFILSLLALILAVFAQDAAAPAETAAVDAVDGATSAPLDFNNEEAVDNAVAELAASQEEGDEKKVILFLRLWWTIIWRSPAHEPSTAMLDHLVNYCLDKTRPCLNSCDESMQCRNALNAWRNAFNATPIDFTISKS